MPIASYKPGRRLDPTEFAVSAGFREALPPEQRRTMNALFGGKDAPEAASKVASPPPTPPIQAKPVQEAPAPAAPGAKRRSFSFAKLAQVEEQAPVVDIGDAVPVEDEAVPPAPQQPIAFAPLPPVIPDLLKAAAPAARHPSVDTAIAILRKVRWAFGAAGGKSTAEENAAEITLAIERVARAAGRAAEVLAGDSRYQRAAAAAAISDLLYDLPSPPPPDLDVKAESFASRAQAVAARLEAGGVNLGAVATAAKLRQDTALFSLTMSIHAAAREFSFCHPAEALVERAVDEVVDAAVAIVDAANLPQGARDEDGALLAATIASVGEIYLRHHADMAQKAVAVLAEMQPVDRAKFEKDGLNLTALFADFRQNAELVGRVAFDKVRRLSRHASVFSAPGLG